MNTKITNKQSKLSEIKAKITSNRKKAQWKAREAIESRGFIFAFLGNL